MNRTRKEWEELPLEHKIEGLREGLFYVANEDSNRILIEARADILELYDELEKIEEIERKRWGSPPKPFGGHISGSG